MGEAVRGAVNAVGIRVNDVLALCVDIICCSVVRRTGTEIAAFRDDLDGCALGGEAADVAASGDPAWRIKMTVAARRPPSG